MKLAVNKYDLFNEKIVEDCRVVSITDIHSNYKALACIAKELGTILPDLVVISGDTIDSIDNPNNKNVFELIKLISKYFPTFISYGNHDNVIFESKLLFIKEEVATNNFEFFDKLKKETNSIILGNKGIEEFRNLTVRAFNLFNPIYLYEDEYRELFLESFYYQYYMVDDSKYTILSSHSPEGYFEGQSLLDKAMVNNKLKNTLVLSGHTHGGMVPLKLQDKLSNTKLAGKGLMTPYFELFPQNVYGHYSENSTNLIISNGVTKWSNCNGAIGKIVNKVFYPEIEVIDLKNGNSNMNYEGYKVKKITKK